MVATGLAVRPEAPARAERQAPLALGVAGVLLVVYLLTLLPGVGFSGDTAKFQFIGRVLGTPHNTGYPIYTMLNAAFVRLVPLGSLAWRANLLSALTMAAACGLLVPVLRWLGCRRTVAAGVALTFGLSATVWAQAVVAEVYALHLLALVGVLALLVRWERNHEDRDLGLALGLLGLSAGHHMLSVLAVPGVAAFVLLHDRRAWRRRAVLVSTAIGLVLGLGSYAYIVWRTQATGPFTYVQSRASSLAELVGVLRGEDFATELFAFPLDQILDERIPNLGRYLREEWSWVLLAVPVGLLHKDHRRLTVMLALWALADLAFVVGFDVTDVQVFMLPTYLCVAVTVALGLQWALGPTGGRRPLAVAMTIALPLAFGAWHWQRIDESRSVPAADRSRIAVATVPGGALLVGHNYEATHFFLYDVLGEGVGRARDVGVADGPSARAVADYVTEGTALDVFGGAQGPGHPVFTVSPSLVEDLRPLGIRAQLVDDRLWRLVSPRAP